MRPLHAILLLAASFGFACSGEGERHRLARVLTSAKSGWRATTFEYREYGSFNGWADDWTLITDLRFDDQTVWTFTDEENALSAASLPGMPSGEVLAPDGWVVDLDWGTQMEGSRDAAFLSVFLYEDAGLPQGNWDFDVPTYAADGMRWEFDDWGGGGGNKRIQAVLELTPAE
jgi:hypothetical protein